MRNTSWIKRTVLLAAISVPGVSQAGDSQQSRDAFVREVVVTLLQTQASHVSARDTVDKAYAAWQRYQELVRESESPSSSAVAR